MGTTIVEKKPRSILEIIITVLAIIGALYHLVATQYLFVGVIQHQNNHFAFSLLLVLLISMRKKTRWWPVTVLLVALGAFATAYIDIFFADLQARIGFPTTLDLVVGIILVIVALEASRRAFGKIIPVLALIFIAYALFGHYLPPPFYHVRFSFSDVITRLTVGLTGMYGSALAVSVNYIFLFFIFGGILQTSGAMDFFMSLGKLAGRKLRGGPAQTAVISSMFVGSVTGSAVANVAITGAFTIPMMKKAGFKPEEAGAVEASASTGGQILPPVMGAAAFLMAGITGIAYKDIMIAAVVPALLYFFAIGINAEFAARSRNLAPITEEVDYRKMFIRMPCFVIPIGMLVFLLMKGYTPMFAAFWTIVGMAIVIIITDLLAKEKPSPKKFIEGIQIGAIGGAKIGVTSAILGFIMMSITMTGIGLKLAGMIETWSMGSLLIAAVITMVISIIFGMGVPTMVAYMLVAVMAVPVMLNMGVSLLQAHFFCMFYAVFSCVTPPVALAALVGAQIAGGNYIKTSLIAFRMCIIPFCLPFILLYNSAVLLQTGDFAAIIGTIVAMVLAIMSVAAMFNNCILQKLFAWQRITYGICAVLLLCYVFTLNWAFFYPGFALAAIVTTLHFVSSRKSRLKMHLVDNS